MQETSSNSEPNAADAELLHRLRRDLDRQIAAYVYKCPEGAVGSPLPAETILNYLGSMRRCLVEPRWEEANICTPQESLTGMGVKGMCVTMAEEDSYALIFDPICEEYHLAWRSADGLGTWGVRVVPRTEALPESEGPGLTASSHDSLRHEPRPQHHKSP